MDEEPAEDGIDRDLGDPATASNPVELAEILRRLNRRHGRERGSGPATYRELAARTGWARSAVGQYLSGQVLPSVERFDTLTTLLGATSAERTALATARDRIEERQRQGTRVAVPQVQVPAPAPVATASPALVPRQLPAGIATFVGRTGDLAELDRLATPDSVHPAVVVVAVSGAAGIGKSALAVHWAHRVADRFPDGQLFVNLRGFDPVGSPTTTDEVIRRFLDSLEVPAERIPTDLDARIGLYRSLVADRRMLIVLDNAVDSTQVHPLLPGAPGCVVVVTSRDQLTGLIAIGGARPLALDLLTRAEAHDLLTGRIGRHRVAAEPGAAAVLIGACARLPLALAVVAARAATHPTFALADLAREVTVSGGLDRLDGGDPSTSVRAVLSWSYRRLAPGPAQLFALLGLHCGPDISTAAAASLTGLPIGRVSALLAELTRVNLLTEHTSGRYTFHDLLRAYAGELAAALEPATATAAVRRVLDHYLHTACAAVAFIAPHRKEVVPAEPGPEVVPERIIDHAQAVSWFNAERPVLFAAIRQAEAAGLATQTWQLTWATGFYLLLRTSWSDWLAILQVASAAVDRAEDRAGQAVVSWGLASVHASLGDYQQADVHGQQALDRYQELGDHDGMAWSHVRIGTTADRLGDYPKLLSQFQQALTQFETTGNQRGQAKVLNGVGWAHAQLGNQPEALRCCQRAWQLYRQLGDRFEEAHVLDSIGFTYHCLGEYEQATTAYRQSLDAFRETGYRYGEAETLSRLGDTRHAAGDTATARTLWEQSLALFEDLGHPDAASVKVKLDTQPLTE